MNESGKEEKSISPENLKPDLFSIQKFITDTQKSNLTYKNQLITRYISSLATKPFVLLSGLSGSGKTKLAQSFAQWICEDENQYCIVPVGADWTNREPLIGYINALNPNEYVLPENGALQLIIEANKEENKNKPYFLILDEMNLSHVERYFADFLSVMESKDKFKLHSDKEQEKTGVPFELSWPKNLFVVGTVNIDETTYMFSPKVLDRANAIEFRVTENEISNFLKSPNPIDLKQLEKKGANMAADFIKTVKNNEFVEINTNELHNTLVNFFGQLQKTGAEFGYRTAMEIHRLYQQLTVINEDVSENDKIDIAVMQKLLPKLHGSRRKLCPILETLGNICVKDIDVKKDIFENEDFKLYQEVDGELVLTVGVLYPLSLEKITRMYQGAIDNGFASYAEA
jgi:5-methylcytosine-specific restriction protein B